MQLVKIEYAEFWIEALWAQWVVSKKVKTNILKCHLEDALFYTLHTPKNIIGPRVDHRITKALTKTYTGYRFYYINTGHSDTECSAIHQLLNERYHVKQVYYIHDLIPIDYPEYYNGNLGISTHAKRVSNMIRLGRLILVNSEYTKTRLKRFCQENDLPERRIEVLHIGVEDSITKAAADTKKTLSNDYVNLIGDYPYFITIGTIEPRKNHLLLLHIWRRMAQEAKQNSQPFPKLLIIGRRGWKNANIIDLLDRCPSIKEHVIELNNLKDDEMISLMQNACALLFPSFEEGWGMPVAEAMTLGLRTICSDIPALRECSQNIAIYIDPLDGRKWRLSIEKYAFNEETKVSNTYRPNTWRDHFKGLENLLK